MIAVPMFFSTHSFPANQNPVLGQHVKCLEDRTLMLDISESWSDLLVSPLVTPIIVLYIIPYITPL